MKQIIISPTKSITAYQFDDLDEKSKAKVLYENAEFLIESNQSFPESQSSNFIEAVEEAERMRTPWFLNEIVREKCNDELIEIAKEENAFYDKEGNLLPLTFFMSKENTVVKVMYNKTIEVQIQ